MPSTTIRARHAEGRLRRWSDEVYAGALLLATAGLVVSVSVLAAWYLFDFATWVALND